MLEKIPLIRGKEKIACRSILTLGYAITLAFFIFWFNPNHIPDNFSGYLHILDFLSFIMVSYIVWQQIIKELFSWKVSSCMKLPIENSPEPNKRVAFLTAFVPGKESYDVLINTLKAMLDADYPHDTWVLDEGDDLKTKEICQKLGIKYFSRKGIEKYNQTEGKFKARTKGGNYNSWFNEHGNNYDYVAQLDVDFIPSKYFLTATLGYFRNSEVGFVGTPQIYGNQSESWIVRGAAEQAFGFYGNMQRGLFGDDMPLFIGANHIVRVAAFNNIGGYADILSKIT